MTLAKAFRPTGFLARMAELSVRSDDEEIASTRENKKRKFNPDFTPQLWFNRVDALHLGLKLRQPVTKKFSLLAEGGYKTGLKKWSYVAGVLYRFASKLGGKLVLNYSAGTIPRTSTGIYPQAITGVVNIFGYSDYFDYYWNEKFRAESEIRLPKIPGSVALAFNVETHSNLAKSTDFDLLRRETIQRENPAITAGRLNSVEFKIVFGDNEAPGVRWATATGNVCGKKSPGF